MTDADAQAGKRDESRMAFEQWWAHRQGGSQFDPFNQKEAAWEAWKYLTRKAEDYKQK